MIKINQWDEIYETHETRKLKRLNWVPIQNKHDGSGYRRIAAHKRNCEIFTAWILMLELASKNKKRGILPQSPEDMAFKTGYPKDIFDLAISVLSQPDINWIQNSEIKAESANLQQSPAIWQNTSPELKGIEGNGIEEKKSAKAHFTKPTIQEISDYCKERNNKVDPEKFFDYYETNGWTQGGKAKIKDWKACVRTWERNNFNAPQKALPLINGKPRQPEMFDDPEEE